MSARSDSVRLAAVADLHYSRNSAGLLQSLIGELGDQGEQADILLVCGDLTDYGLAEEAHVLARDVSTVKTPIIAVLGNHDHESGQAEQVKNVLRDVGVQVLDGDACEVHGIGFTGVKGFAGGFGRGALGPWGEEIIKKFVHEALNEALKLEAGLARLRTQQRVVLLHYSPVQATVEGEPPEIFPYLGSSRLEEPLLRYPVAAVFHGHAHHGTPEGRTSNGTPVYNVSLSLLRAAFPNQPPFRMLELTVGNSAAS